ncbi:hypothetical protein HA151_06260 [Prochlorococcus marinus XMU1419]|uniref:hypothetical protein n=1 Tax=Prochlorococcus marinus TaxID=1219 RepID=UPI001ADA6B49|nr:hypothetical protein [Prochlorococcus marinus]MBO8234119.1 hypothetical protein [Prochlorococcus marinus XMU1419]MBW3077581.1 hypothetical protein [Prochlorococcus marinus str. XMU1419]|tara:strand:- start:6667 stop:6927 length:261 start_codon:yes stop_codon:yes gene_type:complete
MSKLKKERLNQMIEHALSYKQEVNKRRSNSFLKRLKGIIPKPNIYGVTFASLVIFCVFIPPIVTSRSLVDINEINDLMIYEIIDDM